MNYDENGTLNFSEKAIQKKITVENSSYSDRHRFHYGPLPAMDLDMIEYKNDKPAILFETKYGSVVTIDLSDKQFTRLRNTAKALNIPAFCAVYYFPGTNPANQKLNEFGLNHKYYVIPINALAKSYLFLGEPELMTEEKFVSMIYKIKNQPMPALALDKTIDFYPKLPLVLHKNIDTDFMNNGQWDSRLY